MEHGRSTGLLAASGRSEAEPWGGPGGISVNSPFFAEMAKVKGARLKGLFWSYPPKNGPLLLLSSFFPVVVEGSRFGDKSWYPQHWENGSVT